MNIYTLAYELGKHAWEIEELSPREFAEWVAFFKIRHEEEKKARQAAEAKARSQRRR